MNRSPGGPQLAVSDKGAGTLAGRTDAVATEISHRWRVIAVDELRHSIDDFWLDFRRHHWLTLTPIC